MLFAAVHESPHALFVESLQCTNSGAIGGTADMDRPPAPIASEAYDPLLTKAGSNSRSAASP